MAELEKMLSSATDNARTDAEKLRTAYAAYERMDQLSANMQLEVEAKSGALAASLQEAASLRDQLRSLQGKTKSQVLNKGGYS